MQCHGCDGRAVLNRIAIPFPSRDNRSRVRNLPGVIGYPAVLLRNILVSVTLEKLVDSFPLYKSGLYHTEYT